ncbi:hypothetical protein [Kibdelosporangium philippinense]|uniref:hypothetical protein n=1 Tax=Kibdelosporangium philippinense TaxID=211113 RepID=UPI0036172077
MQKTVGAESFTDVTRPGAPGPATDDLLGFPILRLTPYMEQMRTPSGVSSSWGSKAVSRRGLTAIGMKENLCGRTTLPIGASFVPLGFPLLRPRRVEADVDFVRDLTVAELATGMYAESLTTWPHPAPLEVTTRPADCSSRRWPPAPTRPLRGTLMCWLGGSMCLCVTLNDPRFRRDMSST